MDINAFGVASVGSLVEVVRKARKGKRGKRIIIRVGRKVWLETVCVTVRREVSRKQDNVRVSKFA
jgi:hypothetical protein